MRDWLPQETKLRQKLIHLIENHYQLYGFQPIDTPALENIEVLQGKGGGENEKLMFKVLKRGEELEKSSETITLKDRFLWKAEKEFLDQLKNALEGDAQATTEVMKVMVEAIKLSGLADMGL